MSKSNSHWDPALESVLDDQSGLYGPESFRDYITNHGFDTNNYRTAAEISIDTKSDLASVLRENDTMVLRLGSAPDGTGTQFALVHAEDQLDDFFITEAAHESATQIELNLREGGTEFQQYSHQTQDMLRAYHLLPRFSESSLVNLALSTGLISCSLDLDVKTVGTAPVTVNTTFEFEFQPHPTIPQTLHHNNGQVEVDACFVTKRNGKRVAVLVEAKTGSERSLAKHKLFYPLMGIRSDAIPIVDEIIPVYLRARTYREAIAYDIYGCSGIPADTTTPTLTDIEPVSHSQYRVLV